MILTIIPSGYHCIIMKIRGQIRQRMNLEERELKNQNQMNQSHRQKPGYATQLIAPHKGENDLYSWLSIDVLAYKPETDKFTIKYRDLNITKDVSRIHICFNSEHPQYYAQKILDAYQRRAVADSLIRYNLYIENMPQQQEELGSEQVKRLELKAKANQKNLQDADITSLILEINKDYIKTMNGIIFIKYLSEAPQNLVPHNLSLPQKEQKEIPYYGFLELEIKKGKKEYYMFSYDEVFTVEPKDFTETFKEFCLNSLFTQEQVIKAIQQIRHSCNQIQNEQLFLLDFNKVCRVDEYKALQDTYVSEKTLYLKSSWMNELIKIIKTEFESIDSGWFNTNDSSMLADSFVGKNNATESFYEMGKLKRLLTFIKLMMQDSIQIVIENSYHNFYNFLKKIIPEKVEINSSIEVKNHFPGQEKPPRPLFVFDLLKSASANEFVYSTSPRNIVNIIMYFYDKLLEDVKKIPDIEGKALQQVYKIRQRHEAYLSTLSKPQEKPVIEQSDPLFKKIQILQNKWLWDLQQDIKALLEKALDPLFEYITTYDQYKEILSINCEEYEKQLENAEEQKEVEELADEIVKIQKREALLAKNIPESIQISFAEVHCKDLLFFLQNKYKQLLRILKNAIAQKAKQSTAQVLSKFKDMANKIKDSPPNIEKLCEIKDYLNGIPTLMESYQVEIESTLGIYKILENFSYQFSFEDLNKKWEIFGYPKKIMDQIEARKQFLEKEAGKFSEQMKQEQEQFTQSIRDMTKVVASFDQHKDLEKHGEIFKEVQKVREKLNQFQDQAKVFNSREQLFDMEISDYSKVGVLVKEFVPYETLWTTATNWFHNIRSWHDDPWEKLDAPKAEDFVENGLKSLAGVTRFFREKKVQHIQKISESVREELTKFHPKVPLMVALRKRGMYERHWEEISQKVKKTIQPDEEFTFRKVLDLGLLEHLDVCIEVGEKFNFILPLFLFRAAKEYNIEQLLKEMLAQWEGINFQLLPFKNVSYIIKGFDDIQAVLDEHIINSQTMQFSPFKKPFEEQIILWAETLKRTSDIFEEWAKCQVQWMYLQPIFDSPDIAKQLPGEYKKFKAVDTSWKTIMNNAKNIQNVIQVCGSEGLLDKLKENNNSLDIIQKELNNYLEKKREKFARFFFLSNDELLEILSQTKEPTAVQPHLKKVFENIQLVEFDAQKQIHAMYSAESEKINFVEIVDPLKKNVEDWMTEIEEMMKRSVKYELQRSIEEYPLMERTEWVLTHPGQCVLNGSQVHWTTEVENAFDGKFEGGVKGYWERVLTVQMDNLVELVRKKLTKLQAVTLNALIVIDVHAKDVVEKLWQEDVTDKLQFEWISQLRYYWENDDCWVKCIQTVFPYGHEYLGNTSRLVITPLTDKCYMTLMGALKLNLGGAPAGPAGTGKTESTKDLAKALAKQCVVFNCSDQMDYIMVGKFFKGLASSGAWCCFDEFNRINIEVLSVIAQQLQILYGEKAKGSQRVEFEGSDIRLQSTFSVFVTMNPGYAGRTELPDNLKALFRSVAMMVPDYAMIGEIKLYSFGFKQGRDLSKKMVTTFKLSSEQLSSQCHYDYGMRAVSSVINAAGLLKTQDPDMAEDQLLLRALRDVNVPKFLSHDLPLFENIILDLFPTTQQLQSDYKDLSSAIEQACGKFKLQPINPFIHKVFQLYDTIQVRHGLMLVGPTGGGKSSNYRVLQQALTSLASQGFYTVITHVMNPKSITMGQLYGEFDDKTHEWADGVLAYCVRETVKDESGQKHWVIFDGPVDSLWIESMNTVLDDNKKLCLNSGQILTLTPHMTMMFEVEDLEVASPATVSRCGMVYMEPKTLGIQPMINSWLSSLPKLWSEKWKIKEKLENLFKDYANPLLDFMRENCREITSTQDNNIVQSLARILDCFFVNYKDTENKKIPPEEVDGLEKILEGYFVWACVWSICCTTNYEGRKKLNVYFKEKFSNLEYKFPNTEDNTIYDYEFVASQATNTPTHGYRLWSENIKNFEIESSLAYNEIMVPTSDSTRNQYLIKLLLKQSMDILTVGPTGSGKSQNALQLLQRQLGDTFQYISVSFSAQTSANQTQDTIDSKLQKRRKGYFGPQIGKKCIIFVDDLNMPKKEFFGAQPAIELLRQCLGFKGWYSRKDLQFMHLEDIMLFCAMGEPGGGRSVITSRIVRMFNLLAYIELDQNMVKEIFITIVSQWGFKTAPEEIRNLSQQLVDKVLWIYDTVRAELLPTPMKSHYTFNLRDIAKVFQGICNVSLKFCSSPEDIIRLWYHENMRVFHDRLNTQQDRDYFKKLLSSQFENFGFKDEQILNSERIIFGDFLQGRDVEPRNYYQCMDMKDLITKMTDYMDDYNLENQYSSNKSQVKLILFLDACEHIARISRIIRQPQGHALLLGVGGSGRQSLSKLAVFMASTKLTQIEVIKNYNMKSWREDLKNILMFAGIENKPSTFLFVDTQIINEQMVEDINNVLNSGDVTNLYQEKEMEEIIDTCKGECIKKSIQPNKMNVFTQYLNRVKKNIHIILAMSPLGEVFRTRLRMFPSLINCCTIDWFTEWPEEALIGVGRGQIIDYEDDLGITGYTEKFVDTFKFIHKSVEEESVNFLQELRRHNYVTPKSYLELLSLFKVICKTKRNELKLSVQRLQGGLDKLLKANEAVAKMQVILTEKQPQLALTKEETQKMMEKIAIEKAEADETQKIVAKEEAEAQIQEREALELEKDAQTQVEEAQIMLDETLKEVAKLQNTHLVEIKSLSNPPDPVKIVLGGVVILNQDKIKEIKMMPDPDPKAYGKKIEDYFSTAKLYLLDNPRQLLDMLKGYDRENINPAFITKLEQKIMNNKDFSYERAEKCSFALKFLYSWCIGMYNFNKVWKQTKPLRDKLAEVRKFVAEKQKELKEKKQQLEEVTEKIKNLEDLYTQKIQLKERLENDIKECEFKLEMAQKLISGLSGEQVRWGVEVEELKKKEPLVAGNAVVATAMVAYAGPFTLKYREKLEHMWANHLSEIGIQINEGITMRQVLGIPVVIQQWNLNELPKDDTSTENGLIIEWTQRWPLMIDPQKQANKFIRNMGKQKQNGFEAMKITEANFLKTIEKGIHLGQWVLLENVTEELEPSLEPILQKNIVKQGSQLIIQMGDKQIPYDENFKLFMTTNLPNPHYSPEASVKVTIINFAITPLGLEEQMLAKIVELENPEMEAKKLEIVQKNAEDKKQLLNLEDNILKSLSEGSGEIDIFLKDETLIKQLESSKKFAQEITQRMEESKITEVEIDKARESYRPVAFRTSLLFFCIIDLATIDPMYQYSLQSFRQLFIMGVESSPISNELPQRILNINNFFTKLLYENVCRSLFERHKLMFSFLLCQRIINAEGGMDSSEWRYFLAGPSGEIKIAENPTKWIADNSWPEIFRILFGIDKLPAFQGILEHFLSKSDEFAAIYEAQDAHKVPLPSPWNEKLNGFQKVNILKALRPDKIIPAIQDWICDQMSPEYIVSPTFDLQKCYKDSNNITPLIFILSAGSDPVNDFKRFSEEMGMSNSTKSSTISLGQGQGKKAEKLMIEMAQRGGWVLLQNCHLAISWMKDLERVCEEFEQKSENVHKDFRLWLSSFPNNKFPISVLQNSVKMTLEPPKGLRQNLLRSYYNLDEKEISDVKKEGEFKKLLFGFCLFHAIIQERRKFGPIGWNIPYEFTNEDLMVCRRQLKSLLDDYEQIPYKVIHFLGAEINYGGRVTDDKDKILINTILHDYINADVLKDDYAFSKSGIYKSIPTGDIQTYIRYIETLPLNPEPEAFGLHDNADITNAQNEGRVLLETILSVQPRETTGKGKSREEQIEDIATSVQVRTPEVWDVPQIQKKYPTLYEESMNTVLVQELIRYNRLLATMKQTLVDVKKALKGLVVMSEELEKIANSLFDNQVAASWSEVGFLSLKPLASWVDDLILRIKFLQEWIDNGTPKVFWISGFFFPQAFITGTLQNYARRHHIAIDLLSFEYIFKDQMTYQDVKEKPDDGCYIYGMYLEGASWNSTKHMLNESKPKELFSDIPMIHFLPKPNRVTPTTGIYNCPIYKVVSRAGTLSTTGHSTNFVIFMEMKSDQNEAIWVKAGVAAFLSLRY